MAETYDEMCQLLVPQYDFLQNEVLKIASFQKNEELAVIDSGAGSGIFVEKILSMYPLVKCYWVDYSKDFLAVAKKKLSKFKTRVEYILSPVEAKREEKNQEVRDRHIQHTLVISNFRVCLEKALSTVPNTHLVFWEKENPKELKHYVYIEDE